MADRVDIPTSREMHSNLVAFANLPDLDDDRRDAAVGAQLAFKAQALEARAGTYRDVREKLQIVLDDSDGVVVLVEDLAWISRDLDALLATRH